MFVSGSKLYQTGTDAVKLGSSNATNGSGTLTTKPLNMPGPFTVLLKTKAWENIVPARVKVEAGTEVDTAVVYYSQDYQDVRINFNGPLVNSAITITTISDPILDSFPTGNAFSEKRIYLDEVSVYDNHPCQYVWTNGSGQTLSTNDTLKINNFTEGGEYTYTVSVTSASISAVTAHGCQNSKDITVTVVAPSVGNLATTDATVCEDDEISLVADVTNYNGDLSYWWSGPNGFETDEQSPTFEATDDDNGEYSVTVTATLPANASYNCTASAQATVDLTVLTPSVSALTASAGDAVCAGQTVYLSASAESGTQTNLTYVWSSDNGYYSDQQNPSINDATVDTAGQYKVVVTAKQSFDNVECVVKDSAYVDVTIYPVYSVIEYDTICQRQLPYTWGSDTIFQAGTVSDDYEFYRKTSLGCDSIVTLHLTVEDSVTVVVYDTICAGQDYNNYGYHLHDLTPGDYVKRPPYMPNPCDTIVELHLRVNDTLTGIDEQIACDSFTWINGVTYTSSTTTPTWKLTSSAGCDSVVTLHLTILKPSVTSLTAPDVTVCAGSQIYLIRRIKWR